MVKLTDLNGAREVLNICDVCHGIGWYAEQVSYTQQEQRRCENCNGEQDGLIDIHLEVDVEAMAKAICLAEYPDAYIWDHLNENEKEFYRKLARGTSGTILEWARLVRK